MPFLAVGALATIVFAAGRFGADVGAAIVLPVGAVVAAAVLTEVGSGAGRERWRTWALVALVPLLALLSLAAIDIAIGGGAHLTGSVLEAGGADDLADVAERRLRLSEKSFRRAAGEPFIYLAAGLFVGGLYQRRRVAAAFEGSPAAYAGFRGAVVATLVGSVVNDSGAIVFMLGTTFLVATVGFAWGEAARAARDTRPGPANSDKPAP